MASRCVFSTAVAYALSKVGKEGLVLKKEQLQTIHNLYNGKDVFLWLPTGFGKSICYEVLPFLFDYKSSRAGPRNSTVLVVSPLVSLMVDQVCSRRSCRTFSRCSTRARNNFTVRVWKYFTHAQTVCTRPSPFFWEGPGYEAICTCAAILLKHQNPKMSLLQIISLILYSGHTSKQVYKQFSSKYVH